MFIHYFMSAQRLKGASWKVLYLGDGRHHVGSLEWLGVFLFSSFSFPFFKIFHTANPIIPAIINRISWADWIVISVVFINNPTTRIETI